MSEGELDELMGEVGGPCNVMGMVIHFSYKFLRNVRVSSVSSGVRIIPVSSSVGSVCSFVVSSGVTVVGRVE